MPARISLKVLYVGDLSAGGTCAQRLAAVMDNGHDVVALDMYPADLKRKLHRPLERIRRRLFGMRDISRSNERLIEHVRTSRFDVIWIDRGVMITPGTLVSIRATLGAVVIAGYSPDDMINPANQTRQFVDSLRHYDVYFTTKSYGVSELKALGCPRVEFVGNAYDPATHRPVELSHEERTELGGPVGFIGTVERDRAESIRYLADAGVSVKVWGNGWPAWAKRVGAEVTAPGPSQYGDLYAKIICAFDINLCFLRKQNRDLQTQRSVEIPACGAFMLAERTDEHRSLFEEGKEAAFFSDDRELLEKVRYYLDRPEERRAIAEAGRRRCLSSGYSNQSRLAQMFDTISQMLEERTAARQAGTPSHEPGRITNSTRSAS